MANHKDDSGSMKRPFTALKTDETNDSISSCACASLPTPICFRDGYFIAIRGRGGKCTHSLPYQSSCIFGSWNDAEMHLQQMKMKGRIVEYDAFEKIDDATRYSFGENEVAHQAPDINAAISTSSSFLRAFEKIDDAARYALWGNEVAHQAPDINAAISTSSSFLRAFEKIDDAARYALWGNEVAHQAPDINATISTSSSFLRTYREKHREIKWSYRSDATLSDLEELPQDALTSIYRYICSGWRSLADINKMISIIGMVSKSMYQTCVRYVQQEPIRLFQISDRPPSLRTLAFSLGNAARIKSTSVYDCSLSEFIVRWLIFKYCDLSALKALQIPYCSADFSSITLKDKWRLVEDGLVSVHEVKKLCEKSMDDMHREYSQHFAASGLPSLEEIEMHIFPNSFKIYDSLFLWAIDRLVYLKFHFHYASDVEHDYLAAEK